MMQEATEPRASLAERALRARPVDRESGDIVGMKAPLEARDLPVSDCAKLTLCDRLIELSRKDGCSNE